MPESGARWQTNADSVQSTEISLDNLSSPEIGRYRSGDWLMPRVTSDELRNSNQDPEGIAELAARVEVWLDAHDEGRRVRVVEPKGGVL